MKLIELHILQSFSATYYRCAGLNFGLLWTDNPERPGHLETLPSEQCRAIVGAFLRAVVLAVPGARKNSMNGATLPRYVLGTVKDQGQPLQLINAFETPIASRNGFGAPSAEALKAHHEQLKKTWNIATKAEVAIPDVDLNAFVEPKPNVFVGTVNRRTRDKVLDYVKRNAESMSLLILTSEPNCQGFKIERWGEPDRRDTEISGLWLVAEEWVDEENQPF